MIYLTYNDAPSGIYYSQVVDVVKYLNNIQSKEKVKLVALISARNYFANKKKLKEKLPDSIVLPMFPGVSNWKRNLFLLKMTGIFASHKTIMARGPFAAYLALKLKDSGNCSKVIFDARGAYKAELNEYNVVDDPIIKSEIAALEQDVLRRSDKILAVSNALVNYWKEDCSFTSSKHVVIPCTLSDDFIFSFLHEYELKNIKKEAGFAEDDIVMVYSGSSAGWQSFSLVEELMGKIMELNPKVKLLWLTHNLNTQSAFVIKYKSRIVTNWLKPSDVRKYLLAADYGILFREQTVTNKVASPVKFAEYLSCGLKIIISNNLGDFTQFATENNVGFGVEEMNQIQSATYSEKLRCHALALKHLTKENFKNQYLSLLD